MMSACRTVLFTFDAVVSMACVFVAPVAFVTIHCCCHGGAIVVVMIYCLSLLLSVKLVGYYCAGCRHCHSDLSWLCN